jgi:hypothetical protein
MKPGCIGKSNTNILPATQKSATLVRRRIAIKTVPTWPIFEKCPHLREKGGVLTKIWYIRNRLSRTVFLREGPCSQVTPMVTPSAKCGFLRIAGLYRINNKKCGLLHHQDSLKSAESTAKIGLNSAQQRISEIQPLERSSHRAHACLANHRR